VENGESRTENRESRILPHTPSPTTQHRQPTKTKSFALLITWFLLGAQHAHPRSPETHTRANSRARKRRPDIRIKNEQNAQTGSHCLRLRNHERESSLNFPIEKVRETMGESSFLVRDLFVSIPYSTVVFPQLC